MRVVAWHSIAKAQMHGADACVQQWSTPHGDGEFMSRILNVLLMQTVLFSQLSNAREAANASSQHSICGSISLVNPAAMVLSQLRFEVRSRLG